MTEELKPHQIAQLVNKLRDIATKYHAHGCLRELISREVNAALTQRPAEQAGEREVFEAWADANVQSDYSKSDRHCMWWGWQARASLPTQPAEQAEPDHAAEIARLKAVIDQLERREILAVAQQATPELVWEVVAWQRRDRNIVTGEWSEWHEDDDIEEELDPEWAERRPLFTRPAPGVPEDVQREIAAAQAKGDAHD